MAGKLNDFGYDVFVGREVFLDGSEYFTCLDMGSLGSTSFPKRNFRQACNYICDEVERGKRVLLSRSPGSVGSEQRFAEHMEFMLERAISNAGGEMDDVSILHMGKGPSYTIAGREYKPFTPKQMKTLEGLYESRTDMKAYPNPFLDQPRMED